MTVQINQSGVTLQEDNGTEMIGSFEPGLESSELKNFKAHGPCSSEASWVILQPEFEASARLKSLLVYIARHSDVSPTEKLTQMDIARDVMGLGKSFDPSCDAHVRIEISRLRSALCGFYSRLRLARSRRLSIPKGSYRIVLETFQQDRLIAKGTGVGNDPKIAIGTLCADNHLSRRYAFEIECELLTLISGSAFMADDLLSFYCVEGATLEALSAQAKTAGASTLLVTRVFAKEDRMDAFLSVIDPWDLRLIENIRLNTGAGSHQLTSAVSASVGAQAIDPINGRVLQHVFRLHPDSRIARLADVFSFMSNQDRSMLPKALAAARSISNSSDVARALTIDMTRASYCFATDPDIPEMVSITDAAEKLVEKSPHCIWSNLALGYAGISNGRQDLVGRAISSVEVSEPLGAQKADFNLLKSLHEPGSDSQQYEQEVSGHHDQSVFDLIRTGYAAVKDRTNDAAHDVLNQCHHNDLFWIQAFKVTAFTERSQHQNAADVFGQMKQANPDVQDYMHRSITTMVPDVDLSGRIVAGLNRASQ